MVFMMELMALVIMAIIVQIEHIEMMLYVWSFESKIVLFDSVVDTAIKSGDLGSGYIISNSDLKNYQLFILVMIHSLAEYSLR